MTPRLHLSAFIALLTALSSHERTDAAFVVEKSQKNFWSPLRTSCRHQSSAFLLSPCEYQRRPTALSPLQYSNGNDVVRPDQQLVAPINSPAEFASFLDTCTSSTSGGRTSQHENPASSDLRVVKVYATWCQSCRAFDVRYRKLANQHRAPNSDMYSGYPSVQFAEMEFGANEALCRSLGATKLPYLLFYRPGDRVEDPREEFVCGPRNFDMVIEAVERHTSAIGAGVDNVVDMSNQAEPTTQEWSDQMEMGRSMVDGIAKNLQSKQEQPQRRQQRDVSQRQTRSSSGDVDMSSSLRDLT